MDAFQNEAWIHSTTQQNDAFDHFIVMAASHGSPPRCRTFHDFGHVPNSQRH